jgi:hypothetical protein
MTREAEGRETTKLTKLTKETRPLGGFFVILVCLVVPLFFPRLRRAKAVS